MKVHIDNDKLVITGFREPLLGIIDRCAEALLARDKETQPRDVEAGLEVPGKEGDPPKDHGNESPAAALDIDNDPFGFNGEYAGD